MNIWQDSINFHKFHKELFFSIAWKSIGFTVHL